MALMTFEKLSEDTGLSVETLRGYARKGYFKRYLVSTGEKSKRYLVDKMEFEEWVRKSDTAESEQETAQYRSTSATMGSAVERLLRLGQQAQT